MCGCISSGFQLCTGYIVWNLLIDKLDGNTQHGEMHNNIHPFNAYIVLRSTLPAKKSCQCQLSPLEMMIQVDRCFNINASIRVIIACMIDAHVWLFKMLVNNARMHKMSLSNA